ncbi:MAG TPA: permease, partial [Clostridia bacterium]|nr:permease [Clostridia bacterium]
VFLCASFFKDKKKTRRALKMAFNMGRAMAASIVSIVLAIGLILTVLPPADIAAFVSKQSILLATLVAALFGTITLVPAFIAFPLVGTLVNAGVSVVPSVAFLTTLTMVGVVTMPLETKEFGSKFTIVRNGLSFLFALAIALVMGVLI